MIEQIGTRITSKIAGDFTINAENIAAKTLPNLKNKLVKSSAVDVFDTTMAKVTTNAQIDEFDKLEALFDLENPLDRINYMTTLGDKMKRETGVDLVATPTKECLSELKTAAKILKPQLILNKKLKTELPDTIMICNLGYDGVKKTIAGKMGSFKNGSSKKPMTIIQLDRNIFKKEYKGKFKTVIDNVLFVFHHENTHSRQAKERTKSYQALVERGLEVILSPKQQKIMSEFKEKYTKHCDAFNWPKNIFETNLRRDELDKKDKTGLYNMGFISDNIKLFTVTIEKIRTEQNESATAELLKDFNKDFLKKMQPIQQKFKQTIETIKSENMKDWSFRSPLETVAIAAEKEYKGEIQSESMKKLLKKLGAPKTKHLSPLPYNHPVIIKMREAQSSKI